MHFFGTPCRYQGVAGVSMVLNNGYLWCSYVIWKLGDIMVIAAHCYIKGAIVAKVEEQLTNLPQSVSKLMVLNSATT